MQEMPLFPLPGVVLFPGAVLPLHIFEPRYRRMIEDVSAGDSQFGVINMIDGCGMARVGCIAKVVQMEKLPDGRSNIVALGLERFTVVKGTNGRDYPCAVIEMFQENSVPADLGSSVHRASTMLLQVCQLIDRLNNRASLDTASDFPKDPEQLSFWIASSLPHLPSVKQSLLEMKDTGLRLGREISILDDFRNQLRAMVAIEDVFLNVPDHPGQC